MKIIKNSAALLNQAYFCPHVYLFIILFFLTGSTSLTKANSNASGNNNTVLSTSNIEINRAVSDTLNNPEIVKQAKDGKLKLNAKVGKAVGPEIKYMPEWNAFGWFTANDYVEWQVEIPKSGAYEVYLEWSVSDEEAGKPLTFETKDKNLKGIVGKTGSWETFKSEKIGRLQLSAGHQTMKFSPDSKFEKGALLDFREIRLVPVK